MLNIEAGQIERLKKIRKLAKEGSTDGERAAAQSKLEALCEKHGISEAPLESEALITRRFTYTYADEKSILLQVIAHVTDGRILGRYSTTRGMRDVMVKLTNIEFEDAKIWYDHYVASYRDLRKRLVWAFISANDLGWGTSSADELTAEQIAEHWKTSELADGISPSGRPVPRLGGGENGDE